MGGGERGEWKVCRNNEVEGGGGIRIQGRRGRERKETLAIDAHVLEWVGMKLVDHTQEDRKSL